MEQKQIQLNLDPELAKTNLQKAKDDAAGMENLSTGSPAIFPFLFLTRMLFFVETMRQALEKKDSDLAAAQKMAEDKTALADQKLASFGKLEEENTKLKDALDEANKEVTRLKKDKGALTDMVGDISCKRDEPENYLGVLAKKLFLMLEGICLRRIDFLSSTSRKTVDSLLLCEHRILSKLRGRDWSNRNELGPHQLPCQG